MFDNFTLVLKDSEVYTKLPQVYQINDYMIKIWQEKGANESMLENFNKNKNKKFNREQFISLLKDSGANTDSEWVKFYGVNTGLGEAGSRFYELYGRTKDPKTIDDINLNLLKSNLDDSINKYNNLPLGNKLF